MSINVKEMKIALVHDWILNIGGAEQTLKILHELFPSAPIYTLFYNKEFTDKFLPKAKIKTTFLQKTRRWIKNHKLLLPLMPIAVESLDLSSFDVVISSSFSFSKGLVLKPKTIHMCYCYSPTRFLWDWHIEYRESNMENNKLLGTIMQHLLRIWDSQASNRVDHFIAISKNVQKRIKKYYRRDAEVIYPPVETDSNGIKSEKNKEFYLIVSRLFPHKNIAVAIDAFNKLGLPLVIIGDGPERKKLEAMAEKNITFLGELSGKYLNEYYNECKAFIMPQEEDFGITPIEAMNHGKPVLALRKGGALEYVLEGINGEFFEDPTPEILADGVRRLNGSYENYSPLVIKKTAGKFSRQRFEKDIIGFLNKTISRP